MDELLLRSEMLLGQAAMERLQRCHVAVFGLGGVGSYAAEVLVRSGAGMLTLVDQDTYSESNLNRQLGALHSTLGQPKAVVTARRLQEISPACRIRPIVGTYTAADRERFWDSYDYVVDAIDLVSCKIDLICTALDREIPIISALGTGNKLDPTQLQVTDLSKTRGCPLARVLRRELGRLGIRHLKVVYSPEEPQPCLPLEAPPPGRRSVPGSVAWVPAAAGLMLGGAVVMALTEGLRPGEGNKWY